MNRPSQLIKASKVCTAVTAILLLGACATKTGEVFNTAHNQYELSQIESLDPKQKADLFEAIILADVASHKQDHLSAMSYYLYAAELSKDERIIQNGIQSARQAGDALGIEQAAKIWLSLDPDNPEALQVLLEAQMSLGNLSNAIETIDRLLLEANTEPKQYELLEQNVIGHDPRVSFNLLRELRQKYPKNAAVVTAQAKIIYNLASKNQKRDNMLEQSLAQVEQALLIDSLFTPAIRLKSHILYQLRKDLEVVTYLNQLFQ
ncbi:MAG: tetratricopeptide repeat protein, partial [Kangiellaceae bacterium]|nr:tetratricopeptide repeat protein [Kangiellaceae bacterium]